MPISSACNRPLVILIRGTPTHTCLCLLTHLPCSDHSLITCRWMVGGDWAIQPYKSPLSCFGSLFYQSSGWYAGADPTYRCLYKMARKSQPIS